MNSTHILTVLVDNNAGVLFRVSGLFSRRGYNISSISSAETNNPQLAQLTIVANGDDNTIEQIYKQLSKLIDVKEINIVTPASAICREHIIIKLKSDNINSIEQINDKYGSKIVDNSNNTIILELTGDSEQISSFLDEISKFEIIKLIRTGIAALERG
ncbi:MAG: acetolactate synthase small subunit [Oscillospiraceae bacterium]|nr:acetolactate synthase small subunit [Oscillospiraceae bacterium]